jgi:hypothetical protein
MAMYWLLIVAAILLVPSAVSAQSQPTSCSTGLQMCKESIGRQLRAAKLDSSACDKAFPECMKTGVWTGPGSGTRWPVEKK